MRELFQTLKKVYSLKKLISLSRGGTLFTAVKLILRIKGPGITSFRITIKIE